MIWEIVWAALFAASSWWWARRSWRKGYHEGYTAGALAMKQHIFAEMGYVSPEEPGEVEMLWRSRD